MELKENMQFNFVNKMQISLAYTNFCSTGLYTTQKQLKLNAIWGTPENKIRG